MSMSSAKRIIELFAPEYVIVPTSESISLYNVDSQKNIFAITVFIILNAMERLLIINVFH